MSCRCEKHIVEYEKNHPLKDDEMPHATTTHCKKQIHKNEIIQFFIFLTIMIVVPWTFSIVAFIF